MTYSEKNLLYGHIQWYLQPQKFCRRQRTLYSGFYLLIIKKVFLLRCYMHTGKDVPAHFIDVKFSALSESEDPCVTNFQIIRVQKASRAISAFLPCDHGFPFYSLKVLKYLCLYPQTKTTFSLNRGNHFLVNAEIFSC